MEFKMIKIEKWREWHITIIYVVKCTSRCAIIITKLQRKWNETAHRLKIWYLRSKCTK